MIQFNDSRSMPKHLLCLLIFVLSFTDCRKKLPETPVLLLSYNGPALPKDTLINYRKYTFFGEDSIYQYSRGKSIRVIYRYSDPINKIHYQEYDKSGKVLEIGYTRDTCIINPAEFYLDSIYPFSDEIIRFDKKGNVRKRGYATYETLKDFLFANYGYETYEEYDEKGILTSKYYPYYPGEMSHISEEFHPNGQRIARWVQGFPYGSGGLEEYTRWYEDGQLKEKHNFEYMFPADGISYNSRLGIETVREYLSKRYP